MRHQVNLCRIWVKPASVRVRQEPGRHQQAPHASSSLRGMVSHAMASQSGQGGPVCNGEDQFWLLLREMVSRYRSEFGFVPSRYFWTENL
jgi:hypothetical protein